LLASSPSSLQLSSLLLALTAAEGGLYWQRVVVRLGSVRH
jgi:hypothetical protein